jgi:hypothetical protein
LIAQKIHKETICRIPDSKNLHATFNKEGHHKYQPTCISELSDHGMDMWQQVCATLVHSFPTLASCCNIMSLMNVWYISGQGLEIFISGLNKIHTSLKK